MHEKRKLEFQMLRDNHKNEVTMKILSMIEDGRESPKPKYRFEQIKNKFKDMEKNKRKQFQKVKMGSAFTVENVDGENNNKVKGKSGRKFSGGDNLSSSSGELVTSNDENSEDDDKLDQD